MLEVQCSCTKKSTTTEKADRKRMDGTSFDPILPLLAPGVAGKREGQRGTSAHLRPRCPRGRRPSSASLRGSTYQVGHVLLQADFGRNIFINKGHARLNST
ncbi:unnamed protein product, partial [Prorocentrum cordatum]